MMHMDLFTRERALLNDTFAINTVAAYSKNKSIAYSDNAVVIVQTNDIDFINTQKTTIGIILDKVRLNQQFPHAMNPVTNLLSRKAASSFIMKAFRNCQILNV